ncbi:MAG: hypothetical protein IJ043_04945 [Clostridia bacterium]|nr:hypothetical protein [Clostridia bacterium]
MNCIQIQTDQTHHLLRQEIFPAETVPTAIRLEPAGERRTGFQGFGVAITGASCYNLAQMEPAERKALLEEVYSKLSFARLTIGSSDYSAELYSYDDVPEDLDLKHFSIDRDKAYIIPMLKEILTVRPDLTLFASPWSPPGWMKTGGAMCGGYMRPEYIDCYTEYILKFLETYQAEGIHISAITPQNEVHTNQKGRMPACIWHPEHEAAFAVRLKKRLKEKGMDTEIWICDHSFLYARETLWQLENCPDLAEHCDGVAFHYYDGAIENTAVIPQRFPHLQLHFTEAGPRLYDHYADDWCKWGGMMIKALSHGYRSFTGWNLMLNEMGGPNIGPFLCGGLITRHSVTGELSYSGQYKAFCHIAPYITPDSVLQPLAVGETFGQSYSVYPKHIQPPLGITVDDRITVITNPNPQKMQAQFTLGGTQWYAELQPESISTFILE